MTWRFFVDRGGTFTDCLSCSPEGDVSFTKILSDDRAPVRAKEMLAGTAAAELSLGTTLATNALLERRGRPFVLVVTKGFRDLLEIGDQTRPELFALDIQRAAPLTERVVEVDVRVDRDGKRVGAFNCERLSRLMRGVDVAAVAILGAYKDPEVEGEIAEVLRAAGVEFVACSAEQSVEPGLLARMETACLDAYLTPPLAHYLEGLRSSFTKIEFMNSSGDLSNDARGPRALLSGPAGGVVAVRALAARHGASMALGFDMGGTSTDVCRVDTRAPLDLVYESTIDGSRVRAPSVDVHTVAAGGGSICRLDGDRFVVGPRSAGARPGPICYGNGGRELTLTDVNVFLGRFVTERFPFPLDEGAVNVALEALSVASGMAAREIAEGFLRIANEKMADAIRKVSISRGYAPSEHALVVYGGAAGQHACAIADALEVERVLVHPLAGVFSAVGIALAPRATTEEIDGSGRILDDGTLDWAREWCRSRGEGRVRLRYRGTESALSVDVDERDVLASFRALHLARFGYVREHPVEIVSVHARHAFPTRSLDELQVPFVEREACVGPAKIVEDTTTIVVDAGWRATQLDDGTTELRRVEVRELPEAIGDVVTPVSLELFANRIASIAEQMGAQLKETAMSVNIKERLDFSCAVFDDDAKLVANAPHIPVHLGAMSETVRAVAAAHPAPKVGSAFVSNDPNAGGSHLPDITVVCPVHDDDENIRFWVASRGHHADVGGITPGSMPPFATTLEEEGVVLRAVPFVEDELRAALSDARFPARDIEQNLADLRAQLAANHLGRERLRALTQDLRERAIAVHLSAIQEDAAKHVRRAIAALDDGERKFEDALDDGAAIKLAATIDGDRLRLDFTGTSPAVEGNLNAPRAVTVAAVLYVARLLAGRPIPLASGALEPIELVVPRGSLLDPPRGAAVAGGNVETSQRVVDVLLGALEIAAASQGTMNNLTFGDASFGYYETIAGGAGAGADFDGAHCVQTHMTNTRITDPEILEQRYPVYLERFARRRGSGGRGERSGGDGVERVFVSEAEIEVSIVSERRSRAPFGLCGGQDGARGENVVDDERVAAKGTFAVRSGQRFSIFTPGGGGFGQPAVTSSPSTSTKGPS